MTRAEQMKWIGTVAIMGTGALTALNIYPLNIMVGLGASTLMFAAARLQKDKAYMAMNVYFLCMNTVGIVHHYYF